MRIFTTLGKHVTDSDALVRVAEINTQRLRRILVRLQGAPRGAYCLYVTFAATLKAGQKTSPPWRMDLFKSGDLK